MDFDNDNVDDEVVVGVVVDVVFDFVVNGNNFLANIAAVSVVVGVGL